MTNLTAERRVRAIFYWAHVLGPNADVVPEHLRRHALTAVATLQILLIATRGHRSYTRRELDFIHTSIGKQFFASLEALAVYVDAQRVLKGNEAHRKQPTRNRPPVLFKKEKRFSSDTDTEATDENATWGGLGKFEYSKKGLPHALCHATEMVMCGGHHLAFCTTVAESKHKTVIKQPSRLARPYASKNQSDAHMLSAFNRQTLYEAVEKCRMRLKRSAEPVCLPQLSSTVNCDKHAREIVKLWYPLPYGTTWTQDLGRHTPNRWRTQFLSSKALITRGELVTFLYDKLWDAAASTQRPPYRVMCNRLTRELTWEFYGSISIASADQNTRKFVGFDPHLPARRDFVRISRPVSASSTGPDAGKVRSTVVIYACYPPGHTCVTFYIMQIILFVRISGFKSDGIVLPTKMRSPATNTHNVVLTLIRRLSAHQDASLRDDQQRPVCSPPLFMNHALWSYTKTPSRRSVFRGIDNGTAFELDRQLALFCGSNDRERRVHATTHACALYDLVVSERLDTFMNCTVVDEDSSSSSILETITLPFDQ